jgi:hypothetical protein
MRIDGAWRVCDGGIVRPVMRAEAQSASGAWIPIELLLDVGADRTVFDAGLLASLGIPPMPASEKLEGVGGHAESVVVATKMRLERENGTTILIDAQFAAFTDPAALDMSVLGRDVTNMFAVIVDRPQDTVCLLSGNHRYVIVDK